MKKFLIWGLMVFGLVGVVQSLTSCDTGGKNDAKVVEAKYRGTWVSENDTKIGFVLTENKLYNIADEGSPNNHRDAWTVGNVLYVPGLAGIGDGSYGYFDDDQTYTSVSDEKFKKQP